MLTLNLYKVSDNLKTDSYRSTSHYVSETVPTLASDERIMRFKFVRFTKQGVEEPMMLKELSDGEHQLLHSLGLCLLFRETNSLFLLDEPETHSTHIGVPVLSLGCANVYVTLRMWSRKC